MAPKANTICVHPCKIKLMPFRCSVYNTLEASFVRFRDLCPLTNLKCHNQLNVHLPEHQKLTFLLPLILVIAL